MPDFAVRQLQMSLPFVDRVNQISTGDQDLVREAVEDLATGDRPVVIVGNGVFYANAWQPLAEFAEKTNIPVFLSIWSRGAIERPIPEYVGTTFSGPTNGAYSCLSETDVVLLLGAQVDYRMEYGRPPVFTDSTGFISVNSDPNEFPKTVEPKIRIVADSRSVLQQMNAIVTHYVWNHHTWLNKVCGMREALLKKWNGRGCEDQYPLSSLRICREIQPFLDQDITFLIDSGNIGRWANLVLWNRHPEYWFTCGASGVVSWGVPGAIAAKLARPKEPVLLLSGDGSAGFTITEIETALRFNTPYVAIIAHDGAWGIEADSRSLDRRMGTVFGEIRFDKVAEALGGKGVYIEHPNQLAPAVESGLKTETVTVTHAPTELEGVAQ